MEVRHSDEIEIARAPASVLEFLADLEQQPRYWATVHRVRRISGDPGRPGTTYERVIHGFGKPRTALVAIRSLKPGKEMVLESEGRDLPLRVRARIETRPSPIGTRVRIELCAQARGVFGLLRPLLRRRFVRNTRVTLAQLKGLLETPYLPGNAFGARGSNI